ncbi:hydroxypyruvate isomerase family protein [Halomonas huangheensis]|uniref:Xylose isomerase-like TIM barrel domain-containing protein n=1 Tax=Halomonas huangheensis TaxID=1178482 RepID=W1N3Z2_9GAMM|nr:TIM barrel protein [Halomonas huangheensis]ALM51254.1 hydroxypyruvate isomerase [Halomonas huangheensis]ERL49680.1 hypothetical protein BJB45_00750 [Halomonas huangheensis]
MDSYYLSRRKLLRNSLVGTMGLAIPGTISLAANAQKVSPEAQELRGNINHSVARWTYDFLSLEELCQLVASVGFSAIDLVGPEGWDTLKRYGIDSSMCNGAEPNLEDGWSDHRFHSALVESYLRHIDLVNEAGYQNLICFSGNKRELSDEQGLQNAEQGLKRILARAEQKGVTLHMELLNSKVDHPDYLCDNSTWGIELCKRLDSPNFKLLYDIYHMQISEGDVIRTIRENHQYFGHYHTAGVPGRHELDTNQELYYPAIMQAIHSTGFTGYVAQEFKPSGSTTEDKLNALSAAIHTCDI